MDNPFLRYGPAMISFSGGRTSAFMLHKIIQAHGGQLPSDIVVAFANTGKEREETLRFVHECGSRFGVRIVWLEWWDAKPCFEEVGFNSTSRNGEPFDAIIAKKKRLPNWQERWCTSMLKLAPMFAYAESLGWKKGEYAELIGLRDDEGERILRGLAKAEETGRRVAYPLANAKIRKADVMSFWRGMDFDLALEPWEGNCDLCFATPKAVRLARIRRNPSCGLWWSEKEAERNGFFDRRVRVADLMDQVERHPDLFEAASFDEFDAECGDGCGYGEAAE